MFSLFTLFNCFLIKNISKKLPRGNKNEKNQIINVSVESCLTCYSKLN